MVSLLNHLYLHHFVPLGIHHMDRTGDARVEGVHRAQHLERQLGVGHRVGRAERGRQAEELRIEWPSGQVTTVTNLAAEKFLQITEPNGKLRVEFYWPRDSSLARVFVTGDLLTPFVLQTSTDLRTWSRRR